MGVEEQRPATRFYKQKVTGEITEHHGDEGGAITAKPGGKGHGPRIHDLRHVFAVNNLRSWFDRGEDVGALLPVLQAYMGHSSIADTDYYLRLTAESYPHITAAIQRAFGDVVPLLAPGTCDGD